MVDLTVKTMILKIVLFMFLFTLVVGKMRSCNDANAINSFKRPTYDFSIQLLDRVAQETGYHFVFSPISTWLQLISLAEGTKGPTNQEIWRVTRHHRSLCFRRRFKAALNLMEEELSFMTKRINVIAIDKLLHVKTPFESEVERSNTTKVLSLDFSDPDLAAEKVNEAIDINTNDDDFIDRFDGEDFSFTLLMMTGSAFFKGDWRTPFNSAYTSTETFYAETRVPVGNVRLMSQMGYFNITEVPFINARVLELPFNTNGRVSMLVFLPTAAGNVYDLFYTLNNIRLMTIFSLFKRTGTKLVTVKLPRFKISTEVGNIPELVYDMGVKRIFDANLANFRGMTDYQVITSIMTQITEIEITEQGASASVTEFLIKLDHNNSTDFIANRPFAYAIVDRKTEVILFAGMYRNPEIY